MSVAASVFLMGLAALTVVSFLNALRDDAKKTDKDKLRFGLIILAGRWSLLAVVAFCWWIRPSVILGIGALTAFIATLVPELVRSLISKADKINEPTSGQGR